MGIVVVLLVLVCAVVLAGGSGRRAHASPLRLSIRSGEVRAQRVLARAIAVAPSTQRAALRDRVITQKEYRGAIQATRSCVASEVRKVLRAASVDTVVEVSQPVLSRDGFQYSYDWGFSSQGGAEASAIAPEVRDRVLEANRRCEEKFRNVIERVYLADLQADPSYMVVQVAAFTRCLEDAQVLPRGTALDASKLDHIHGSITGQSRFADTDEARALAADAELAYTCLAEFPSLAERPGT